MYSLNTFLEKFFPLCSWKDVQNNTVQGSKKKKNRNNASIRIWIVFCNSHSGIFMEDKLKLNNIDESEKY